MGCFKPYAIGKTGLIQSKTLLNVEDYMLICAPFQFSRHRGVLLVILSPQEGVFFRQFRNKLGKISFTFAKNGNRDQVNFFVRTKLDRTDEGLVEVMSAQPVLLYVPQRSGRDSRRLHHPMCRAVTAA